MVLKCVIDTNIYSGFNRGSLQLKQFGSPKNEFFIPLTVIAELRAGFKVGNRQALNESVLSNFLNAPNTTILKPSEATTKKYAHIYSQLRQAGKSIGTNDIWIAALCLEHKLPLLTLDDGFKQIEDLACIDI